MKGKILLFVLILILIIGCSEVSKEIPSETTKWPEVYFCPRENCSERMVEVLESAEESVHCALFDINLKDVIGVLAEKSKSMDVKLVVDNNYYHKIKGENVRQDDNNQLTHNKFCIVDGKKVTTGSFNPTERGAYKNNNNFLVFYSKYLAENYEDEFDELWNGVFGDGGKVKTPVIYLNNKRVENYFCPEDDCKGHVINILRRARKSVYFMTFSFTDEEIADAILFNDEAEIKGVFEKTQAGSKYSQYHRLNDFKMDVKKDSNSYNMHHKVFIVDGEIVITGSYNPTGAGSHKNDENVVVIYDKDIAKEYLEEFELVWGKE